MNRLQSITVGAIALLAGGVVLVGFQANDRQVEMHSVSEAALSTAIVEAAELGAEQASARLYEVDPTHTNVLFKIRHGSVSNFYGRFNDIQGTVNFDEDDFANSSMDITVQMKSVDTNNRSRDGTLRGADFFNTRQYDEAHFVSGKITADGGGRYTMAGDFTFQGQTVPINAQVYDVRAGKFNGFVVMGVEARFTIKRSDFGLTKYLDTKNPENGPLGDRVEVIVAIEAVRK